MKSKYLKPKIYIEYLIAKLIIFLSFLIKRWEKNQIEHYSKIPLKHQPVFIIGAPRTGSTILYQTITNRYDVLYIDNLACKFYKNLFFGMWLSNKIFKQKAHNCFQSDHGNTKGLHAPSECGGFWYRWLPTDKHFIDYSDISDCMVDEIRDELTAIINCFDKPIIFKNLNMGQRMRLIQKIFPEAKFIFVRRDPLFTAQSIINAKRKLNISDDHYWSIMPYNIAELEKLPSYEQVTKQIFFLEKQICSDSKLFNANSMLEIQYTNLDGQAIVDIGKQLCFKCKSSYMDEFIKITDKNSLNDSEITQIKVEISKLDWNKTSMQAYCDK